MKKLKKCKICNIESDLLDFPKNRRRCKKCYADQRNKIYTKNKQSILKKAKYDYKYGGRKEKIKKYNKENRNKILKRKKNYRENNKDKIRKYETIYRNNRIKNDVMFRIMTNFRTNIRIRLRNKLKSKVKDKSKTKSVSKDLHYTMEGLKQHIESKFEPWMTWDNWGTYRVDTWDDNDSGTWTWQIDHIIPHSHFNYTSMEDEEFKKCWDLDNLRPLSAKQNITDNNRR